MVLPPGELDALRRRDEQVLNRIVHDHSARLYRAARGLGHSADEAEDLVQEVFLTFVATLDRFEGRAAIQTWLYGILLRKAKERWRERTREETHDAIDDDWELRFDRAGNWARPPVDPDRALTSREASDAIRDCVMALPEHQRSALLLRQIEGFTAAEASKILDLTVTHVGVLLHRARLRMRACLDGKGWRTNSR